MSDSISAVIPMYNEEAYIKLSLTLLQNVLEEITRDYEIIVVNDASTDTSPSIVEELKKYNPRIRMVHHEQNRFLGETLKTGFNEARKTLVLYTDADRPFDMQEVKRAVRILNESKADVISAYRNSRGGEGIKRWIYSYAYNFIIKILFGLNVKDVNFSFKLFKRNILESFTLISEGSFIDAEFLIQCTSNGFKIMQFGTDYFPRRRGISRLCNFYHIRKIICEMIQFKRSLLLEHNKE